MQLVVVRCKTKLDSSQLRIPRADLRADVRILAMLRRQIERCTISPHLGMSQIFTIMKITNLIGKQAPP